MTEYILEHPNGAIIASYSKGGRLKKIVAKRGFLHPKRFIEAIPCLEKEIDKNILKPYSPVKDDFFTKAQKAWYEFYTKQSGLEYRFTAADGGSLKQIGKHLTSISGGSAEALAAW
ncbi:MAG: hypothetical protein JEZ14_25790, partial [Marinilabiliaceae bacterium]|nr:hypothetical protein [Marinilabiliaceae bacterium]